MSEIILYDYWRSSASYRVRIALNLAGLEYKAVSIDLLEKEHKSPEYLARNPQGLVPVLAIDDQQFTQSLAILDYLDTTRNLGLLPQDPAQRAKVAALAHSLAVDVHPVCNLGVVAHAADLLDGKEGVKEDWMKRFIRPGLLAFEQMLSTFNPNPFVNGNSPGLSEICLMPQLYNADRWEVNYSDCSNILALSAACKNIEAFDKARPEQINKN